MNRKYWFFGIAACAALVISWLGYIHRNGNAIDEPKSDAQVQHMAEQARQTAARPSMVVTPLTDVKQLVTVVASPEDGLVRLPALAKALARAVAGGDKRAIAEAFENATERETWPSAVVDRAVSEYGQDPNLYVRYFAAEELLKIGDAAGLSSITSIVASVAPIAGLGASMPDGRPLQTNDLRIEAALLAGRFRVKQAVPAINQLYAQTKKAILYPALVALEMPAATSMLEARPYHVSASALKGYGQARALRFRRQVEQTFATATVLSVKVAAAWATNRLSESSAAQAYLIGTAKQVLNGKLDMSMQDGSDLFKYLGTIKTQQSEEVLEETLSSSVERYRQIAVVNLLYKQSDKKKALSVLAAQLNGTSDANLPWDFTLKVAAQFKRDPVISSAARTYSQRSSDLSWERYSDDRANWPIYNWLDGFTISTVN